MGTRPVAVSYDGRYVAFQSSANDLVSGIGVTWDLNWTQIADIPTEELAALLGLLASHPDDYFGSVRATLSTETTDGIEVYLCPAGDTPSYSDVSSSAEVELNDVQPGTYTAYAFNPATYHWAAGVSVTVGFGAQASVALNVNQTGAVVIPCREPGQSLDDITGTGTGTVV